jgi:4-hydroxy-3-methylbut-2-enyl diphosphate reductase
MIITIEQNAKPCPGVEKAVTMAEEILRRGEILYSEGQLIHNRREVDRLQKLNLLDFNMISIEDKNNNDDLPNSHFIIRTHGESDDLIQKIYDFGLQIIDATCPIVKHSQELVEQHIDDGLGIIIVGDKEHPEVKGLMTRAKGFGIVVSSIDEVQKLDFEERSLLLAQTTIDPYLFSEVCRCLSSRLSGLKIADTTCRFLRNRQKHIVEFCRNQDILIVVGGKNSANCQLLYKTALAENKRTYYIEEPEEIDMSWFNNGIDKVGISGGASTPKWQLDEIRMYLENQQNIKNPKGLKYRKGGKFLWWKRRNRKTMN